jgi:protoporphyrin/coproporphyrin ferrochelatase
VVSRPSYDAVIVVSFGGPEAPDDVMPFLENVTRGRDVPPERLQAVARQYDAVGGVSPINALNRALVAALDVELAAAGHSLPVYWGNRNWHPLLTDTVRQMRDDGVERALAFVTSAYSSYSSCRQYLENIEEARMMAGPGAPVVDKLRQFFDHPGFVEPFARNLADAVVSLPVGVRARARVAFTAHSLPISMAERSDYVAQLEETARLVAVRGAPSLAWDLVYQSRSGPPTQRWLEPDIGAHTERVAADGVPALIVVPIGFVSDHMEVVYDLDVVAAERAREVGITFARVATPDTTPEFVAMVRELIEERLDPDRPRRALSTLGVRPDVCPGCCTVPEKVRR